MLSSFSNFTVNRILPICIFWLGLLPLTLSAQDINTLMNQGMANYNQGNFPEAITDFDKVLQQEPKNTSALLQLALSKSKLKSFVEAIDDFDKLIEIAPNNAIAYLNRGIVRSQLGDPSGAILDFKKTISLESTLAYAYILLANANLELNNPAVAEAAYSDAIKKISKNPQLYFSRGSLRLQLENFEGAEEDLNKAIALEGENSEALYLRGTLFMRKKNYRSAINDFSASLNLNENNYTALLLRAKAYEELSMFTEALQDIDEFLSVKKNNPEAYCRKGIILLSQGYKNEALIEFNNALSFDPTNSEALLNRSKIKLESGDNSGAIIDYYQLFKLIPNDPQIYIGMAKAKAGVSDYLGAKEEIEKALKINPQSLPALEFNAELLWLSKETAAALNAFKSLCENQTNNSFSCLRLAEIELYQKDINAAIKTIESVIKKNPEYAEAYLIKAKAEEQQGNFSKAINDVNRLLQLKPEYKPAYIYRALIQEKLGNREGALQDLDAVIESTPNLPEAFLNRAQMLLRNQNYKNAELDFSRTLTLDSTLLEAWLGRGIARYELQEFENSKSDLLKSIQLKPNEYLSHFYLAQVYKKKGLFIEARKSFETADNILPGQIELWKTWTDMEWESGNFSNADPLIRKILDANPQDLQAREKHGYYALIIKDTITALADFEIILKAKPDNLPIRIQTALIKTSQKNFSAAIAELTQIISQDPNQLEARIARAKLYFQENKPQEAITDLTFVVNTDSTRFEPYSLLATCNQKLKNWEEAQKNWEKYRTKNILSPSETLDLAICYFETGNLNSALSEFIAFCNKNPENNDARFYLGKTQFLLGNYSESANSLTEVLNKNPDLSQAWYYKGLSNSGLGKNLEAIEDFNTALKLDPTLIDASIRKANILFSQKQYLQAIDEFEKLISTNPTKFEIWMKYGLSAYNSEKHSLADSAFSKALAINENLEEAWYYQGLSRLKLGKAAEAEYCFTKRSTFTLPPPSVWKNRAISRIQQNKTAPAIEDLNQYLSTETTDIEMIQLRAELLLSQKEYTLAVQDYVTLILQNPSDDAAFYGKGMGYLGLRENENALANFNQAIILKPNEKKYIQARANLLIQENKLALAEQDLNFLTNNSPEDKETKLLYAKSLVESGKSNDAISIFEELLKSPPVNPVVFQNLGSLYFQQQNWQNAIDNYSYYLKQSPNDTLSLHNRAQSAEKLKNYTLASQDYTQLAKLSPDNFSYQYGKANSLAKTENFQEALNATNAALTLSPLNPELVLIRAQLNKTKKDTAQLIQDLESLLKIKPEQWNIKLELAQLYLNTGENTAALYQLNEFILNDPNNKEALLLKASILEKTGNSENAIEAYSTLINVYPDLIDARKKRTSLYLTNQLYAQALSDLDFIVQNEPDNIKAKIDRINCRLSLKQFGPAEKELQSLGETGHQPEFPSLYSTLGSVRLELNQNKNALQAFQEHLKLFPKDTATLRIVANLSSETADYLFSVQSYQQLEKYYPQDPEIPRQIALGLVKAGNPAETLPALNRALELNPDQPDLLLLRANLSKDKDDFKQTILDLEKIIKKNPDQTHTWLPLARAYVMVKKPNEALTAYEEFLTAFPEEYEVFIEAAKVAQDNEKLAKAILWLDKAEEIQPQKIEISQLQYPLRIQLGDSIGAKSPLDKIANASPALTTPRYLLGRIACKQEKWDDAISYFTPIVEADSTYPDLYRWLALANLNVANPKESYKWLNKQLTIQAIDTSALRLHAQLAESFGDTEKALLDWQNLISFYPQDAYLIKKKALALYNLKQTELAIPAIDQAIKLQPKDPELRLIRAELLNGKNDFTTIAQDLEAVTDAQPENAKAWFKLGDAKYALQVFPQAAEAYRKGLAIDPAFAPGWLGLARSSIKTNSLKEAEEAYNQVENINPNLVYLPTERYLLYAKLGKSTEALNSIRQELIKNPANNEAREIRLEINKTLNDTVAILEDINFLLNKDPSKALLRLDRAKIYYNQKEYSSSIQDLSLIVTIRPDISEAWFFRGEANRQMSVYETAYNDLEQAYKMKYPDPTLPWKIAQCKIEQGQPKAAKPWLDIYLNSSGNDPMALLERAKLRKENKEFMSALEDLNKAISLKPEDKSMLILKASWLCDLKQFREASTLFIENLSPENTNPQLLLQAADASARSGEITYALSWYAKGLVSPDAPYTSFQNAAMLARQLGQKDQALEWLSRAIEIKPQERGLYDERASLLLEMGRNAEASADYEKISSLERGSETAYAQMGLLKQEEQSWAEAIQAYAKAQKINPNNYLYPYELGKIYLKIEQTDSATIAFNKALALNDTLAEAWYVTAKDAYTKKQYSEAAQRFTKCIELNYPIKGIYYYRAEANRFNQEYQKAIDDYSLAYFEDQAPLELLANRGKCYLELKQVESAIKDLSKAVNISPNDAELHLILASAYRLVNNDEGCLREISAALKLKGDNASIFLERANLYLKNGDRNAAFKDINRALEINPEFLPALKTRAAYFQQDLKWKDALKDLELIQKLDPENVELYYPLALCLDNLSRTAEALQAYNQYTKSSGKRPEAWYRKGELELINNDTIAALECFSNAYTLDTTSSVSLTKLAQIYIAKQQFPQARPYITKLISIQPEKGIWNYELGRILNAEGNSAEVVAQLTVAEKKGFVPLNLFFLRAQNSIQQKDTLGAKKDLETYLFQQKEDTAAIYLLGKIEFNQQNYSSAIKKFDKVITAGNRSEDVLNSRLFCRLQLQDSTLALEDLNSLLTNYPPTPQRLELRAKIYQSKNQIKNAITDWEQLIQQQPTRPDLYLNIAYGKQQLGDTLGALPYFTQAATLKPNDPDILWEKAKAQAADLKPGDAANTLDQLLTVAPERTALYLQKAEWLLAAEQPLVAVQAFDTYLKFFPQNGQAAFRLAQTRFAISDYAGTLAAIQQAENAGYSPKELPDLKIKALTQSGRTEFPEKDLLALLSQNPNDTISLYRLIHQQYTAARYTDVLKTLSNYPLPINSSGDWYFLLSESLRNTGNKDSSTFWLNKAIEARVSQPLAYVQRASLSLETQHVENAEADLSKALLLSPALDTALAMRFAIRLAKGNISDAIADVSELIRIKGETVDLIEKRLSCYEKAKDSLGMLQDLQKLEQLGALKDSGYLLKAKLMDSQGDLLGAKIAYQQYLRLNPEDKTVALRLAQIKALSDEPEDAINAFEEIVQLNPNYALGWLQLGRLYSKTNDFQNTIRCLNYYLDTLHQSNTEALLLRAPAYTRLGNKEEAILDYTQALSQDSLLPEAWCSLGILHYSLSRPVDAINDFTKTLALNDRFNEAYLFRGKTYYERQQYNLAKADFEQLFQREPNNFEVGALYANTLIETGDTFSALNIYDELIKQKPQDKELFRLRAEMLFKMKKYDRALVDYDFIYKSDTTNENIIGNIGICQYYLSNYPDAMIWLNRAASLNSQKAEYPFYLGMCYRKEQNLDKALEYYNTALMITPNYPEALVNRANIRYSRKDFSGAMPDYTKAIELRPDYIEAYIKRGFAKYDLGDYRSAVRDYSKVLELDPNNIEALENRGINRLKYLDVKGALEDFEKTISIEPNNGRHYCNRGLAKVGLNQKESGCIDMSTAGEKGYDKAYEYIKQLCNR